MKVALFCIFLLGLHSLTQALLRIKLQYWFPKHERHWVEATAVCQQELSNYRHNNRTLLCPSPCACAADCILTNITGTIQADFASAQVLLGLIPGMLGYLGPTMAEVAALSTYKPLLAMLLALGSPAINLTRLFQHVDACEPYLKPVSKFSRVWFAWLAKNCRFFRTVIRLMSYVGALVAIANNIFTSVYTDLRTISGWRCGALFMPLVWSLLASVVHVWGMVAIRIPLEKGYTTFSPKCLLKSSLFHRSARSSNGHIISSILFWLASVFALIHVIFGVMELSSLVFISTFEALQVFLLYVSSAFLCRCIILLELTEMRYELAQRVALGSAMPRK